MKKLKAFILAATGAIALQAQAIVFTGDIICSIDNVAFYENPYIMDPPPSTWDGTFYGLGVGDSVIGSYRYVSDTIDGTFSFTAIGDPTIKNSLSCSISLGINNPKTFPAQIWAWSTLTVDHSVVTDFTMQNVSGAGGWAPVPDGELLIGCRGVPFDEFGVAWSDGNDSIYAHGSLDFKPPLAVPDNGSTMLLLLASILPIALLSKRFRTWRMEESSNRAPV